jgi:7-carboxy-7-deazaguanine synthase
VFGKNPIRENETHLDGSSLAVQEVFYTLQGEGPYSGRPATFIRLAGCNLACHFCDTEFETGMTNRVPILDIAQQVATSRIRDFVVLTGGEPMRQNIVPLITALLDSGVQLVQIETAGTLWVPGLEDLLDEGSVELVCSPKTPSIHPRMVEWCTHWKYVIEAGKVDPDDGLPIMGMQTRNIEMRQRIWRPWMNRNLAWWQSMGASMGTIWVSPCDAHESDRFEMIPGEPTTKNTEAAVLSALQHGYRLSLQTHKIVRLP